MRFLYHQSNILVPWVAERVEGLIFDDDAVAIGVELEGQIAAAVVYDEFTRNGCSIALASDGRKRWVSKGFIVRLFAYPFIQCGLKRMSALISVDNKPSIRFTESLGMVREGLLRQAGPHGEDLIAYGMLREECHFIPK